jgi:hypothetical protein
MTAYSYETGTQTYPTVRQTDARIASLLYSSLGPAQTILNIDAGTGSYETTDRYVLAVEPSKAMRERRIALGRTPAVDASAEK